MEYNRDKKGGPTNTISPLMRLSNSSKLNFRNTPPIRSKYLVKSLNQRFGLYFASGLGKKKPLIISGF